MMYIFIAPFSYFIRAVEHHVNESLSVITDNKIVMGFQGELKHWMYFIVDQSFTLSLNTKRFF